MIHKLLTGKGRMKKVVSLLLCLALLGGSVISSNVTAEAESDMTVEAEDEAAEETIEEETKEVESSAEDADDETSETEDTVEESTIEEALETSDIMVLSLDGSSDDGISMVDDYPGEDGHGDDNDNNREESSSLTIKVDDEETLSYSERGSSYTISSYQVNSGSDYINVSGSTGDTSLTVTGMEAGTAVVVVVYTSTGGGNTKTVTVTYTITVKEGDISVYWDTVTTTTNSSGSVTGITAQNSETGVREVSITGGSATNGGSVTHENGTTTSWSSTTTELTYTTDSVSTTDTETVTVTITPDDGYYVTFVAICCCGSGLPASCTTFGNGNAYTGNYSISDAGTISLDVYLNREHGFHHSSNDDYYFIMIATAKIPSPLYVEYQYGDIVNYIAAYNTENSTNLSSNLFTDSADTWTDTYTGNAYGTIDTGVINGVMTDDTQYKYTYESGSNSSEAEWKHYANSITEEALAQAAAAGYYFVGWEATYYTTCEETSNDSGSYNNYTYTFSNQYGTTSDYYQPGNQVELTVHVKLVAQWVKVYPTPGTITITKTFDGLETDEYPSSITFTVTGGTVDQTVELTSGNNWTATVSGLNPGTYTVTETSGYTVSGYDCSTDINVTVSVNGENVSSTSTSGTSTAVTLGYKVTTTYDSSTNTNSYTVTTYDANVTFKNTYIASPVSLSVKKLVSGNMGDTSKIFSFTLSVKDTEGTAYTGDLKYTLNDGAETTKSVDSGTETYTFTLTHNDTIVFTEIPYGYSVVVEEASYTYDGYTTTYTVDGGTKLSGLTYTNTKITADTTLVFTNEKTVSAPTGLTSDVAPYAAALAIALGGAVLMFASRRRRV